MKLSFILLIVVLDDVVQPLPSAMNGPPAKKQRHEALRSLLMPGINHSSLARLLDKIKSTPELLDHEPVGRKTIERATFELFSEAATTMHLPMSDGRMLAWDACSPQLVLQSFVSRHVGFRDLLQDRLRKRPCTFARQWRMIVYHDEVVPGNVLKPDNRRKFNIVYFSFLEMDSALRNELAWLPFAVLRTSVMKDVDGQMSCMVRVLMEAMFLKPDDGFNSMGVSLHFEHPVLFFAQLDTILCDESAWKSTLGAKGSAGLRPCLKCKNCVMVGSALDDADSTGYLTCVSCSDIAQFDENTDAELWQLADHLEASRAHMNKTEFERLQKASGLNHLKHGLLLCRALRPHVPAVSASTYDAMHNYFSHGVAALELHLFLTYCAQFKIGFRQIEEYCSADWKMRSHGNVKRRAGSVFSDNKEKASKDVGFKGMASDVLAVFPLVRQLAATVVEPRIGKTAELESFLAMCDIVRLMQRLKGKRLGKVTLADADQLQDLQRRHLQLFVVAYGKEEVKPKHHFALHLPQSLRKHGFFLDTFVHERKHRVAKRLAGQIDNLATFERSLMCAVLNEHMHTEHKSFVDSLAGQIVESTQLADRLAADDVTIASQMTVSFDSFCKDDIVLGAGHALLVKACMRIDMDFALLVHTYKLIGNEGAGQLWDPTGTHAVFYVSEEYIRPSYWSFNANRLLTLE